MCNFGAPLLLGYSNDDDEPQHQRKEGSRRTKVGGCLFLLLALLDRIRLGVVPPPPSLRRGKGEVIQIISG